MAKVNSQPSKYLLRIRGEQDFSLAFGQRTHLIAKSDKIKDNEYSLLLTSLHVCKEMYKPGVIEADVQIIKTKNAATSTQVCTGPDDAALFGDLLGARVDLTDQDYDKEGYDYDENMAKDYILYNYEPRFENVAGITGFFVKLYAYSPDKMLTLRRYSACYTGKVLGEDILIDIVDSDKNAAYKTETKDKEEVTTRTPFISTLQIDLHQLSYQDSKKNTLEIIQPYLVQQNETEHEFVSRIANRCGEFFFYENGSLHLGCVPLKNAAGNAVAAQSVGTFRQLTMPGQYAHDDLVPAWISDYMRDNVSASATDAKKQEKDDAKAAHAKQSADVSAQYYGPATDQVNNYTYKDASGSEKFWTQMAKNSAADIIDGFSLNSATFWICRIKAILSKETLAASLGAQVYEATKKSIRTGVLVKEAKDEFREKHLDTLTYSEMSNSADSSTTVSPYSNYAYALDGKFYSTMAQLEKESAKTVVRVVLEADNVRPQFLGSTFLLNSASTEEYAVVKVTYDARQEADGTTRTYSCVVEGVKKVQPSLAGTKPLVYANQEAFVDRSKMAYEDPATNTQFLPLPLPNNTRGKARPQPATVMDTSDPCSLNRIRIMYPWQKKETDKDPAAPVCLPDANIQERRKKRHNESKKNLYNYSPWIRMATPMAGKGYGVKFIPSEGDEVMVDYENGDMERPFVVGLLYSQRTGGSTPKYSIVSPLGDKLQFFEAIDPGVGFAKSFLPVLKGVQFVYPGMKWNGLAQLGGGIVMQDKNMLNRILLDTSSRSLYILSSLGNISLDAFKGITIKAPYGKISIEGKDVEIKASNKLTLQSGGNIKKTKYLSADSLAAVAGNAASSFMDSASKDIESLTEVIDVEALRCLWDAILRPVDGTMKLHSDRYLCLEGGSGTAAVPKSMVFDEYQAHDSRIQKTLYFAKSKATKIEEGARFLKDRKDEYDAHRQALLDNINRAIPVPPQNAPAENAGDGNAVNGNVTFKRGNDVIEKDDFREIFANDDNFGLRDLIVGRNNYENFKTYIDQFKVEGNPASIAPIMSEINTIKEIMRLIYSKVEKMTAFRESMADLPAKELNVKFDAAEDGEMNFDKMQTALGNYMNSDDVKKIFDASKPGFATFDIEVLKKLRRKLYYEIIQGWRALLSYDAARDAGENAFDAENAETVTDNDANWKRYMSGLKYTPVKVEEGWMKKYVTGVWKKAFDKYPKDFYTDEVGKRFRARSGSQYIWNPECKGGVLIADGKGRTCEIEGTSIKASNSQADLKYIEEMLAD